MSSAAHFQFYMKAHIDEVTSIVTNGSDVVVSGSRDNSTVVWRLHGNSSTHRRLTGHHHFVADVTLSSNGQSAVSASWDRQLRLWDLVAGTCVKSFLGHLNEVYSVDFWLDDIHFVSGSRDTRVMNWNINGQSSEIGRHTNWVSSVRFLNNCTVVSASWDQTVKIWDITKQSLIHNFTGHNNIVRKLAISPCRQLIASAYNDGILKVWKASDLSISRSINVGFRIFDLSFHPSKRWISIATKDGVKIWDDYNSKFIHNLQPTDKQKAYCKSLTWNSVGSTLFTGYTDGDIGVWLIR